MQRREFAQGVGAALAVGAVWTPLAQAQILPQPGKDYLTVNPPAPVLGPSGKIEVVEFFWYNCPHCNAFEPMLNAWVKQLPKDVRFRRVHVAFDTSYVPQQRLYFTLEAMGLVAKLHAKVFEAIHVKRLQLTNGQAIAQWMGAQGVDIPQFVEKYNSPEVVDNARAASKLQDEYRVAGVPALGLAGRFYTDGEIAANMSRVLQVATYLLSEIRQGR
jgi:thiol:disulfide interchange protein DsbA